MSHALDCRCGARLVGSERVTHRCPAVCSCTPREGLHHPTCPRYAEDHGSPTSAPTERFPAWEVRVPKSMIADVNAASPRVYVEDDGQHWMQDRDGSSVPLIILRDDHQRVRIVDDAATDLADGSPTPAQQRREDFHKEPK